MSDSLIERPRNADLQAALAFVAAVDRGDDHGIEQLWEDAAPRQLMLCLALTTLARCPEKMREILHPDPAVRAVNFARVAALLAMEDNA